MMMTPEKQKVLDALWAHMAERGDFPTLSHSIGNVVGAVQAHSDHLDKLVSAVISDFSLTQKVLRLANSAMYSPFGGNVATVSRAVLVIGQETVGHLAVGMRLLDSFKGMAKGREGAKRALAEVMLAGLVVRRLTEEAGVQGGEEAVVCTLLSRLGELLCIFYAPDDWGKIEAMVAAEDVSLDAAATAVLGVSLTELGQETAARWGLPAQLRETLKPFEPPAAQEPLSHSGWLQAMAAFSGEAARAMTTGTPVEVKAAVERFSPFIGMELRDTRATIDKLSAEARKDGGWEGLADVVKVEPEESKKPRDAADRLAGGVAEIADSAKDCQFSVLLSMALEVLKSSLGCARTIAFVLDPVSKRYNARAGFGRLVEGQIGTLFFEGGFAPDVFHLALSSKAPVYIGNAEDVKIRARMPVWHRQTLNDARSLVLLPVMAKGRALALLYADWTVEDTPPLTSRETRLLKELITELQASFELAQPAGKVAPLRPV